jgi:hypothetical protein
MIVYRKLVEERALRFLLWSQHRQSPFILKQIESVKGLQIKKSFSTELAHRDTCCALAECPLSSGRLCRSRTQHPVIEYGKYWTKEGSVP